jgi:hypothetical protein
MYDVLGYGYNATGEYANASACGFQVIDIDRFKKENPTRLPDPEIVSASEYKESYGAAAKDYVLSLSTNFTSSLSLPLFGKTLSSTFTESVTTGTHFNGKYIYGSYDLLIKQRRVRINSDVITLQNYLTPDFIADVNSYYTTPEVLVQRYGTHVLMDIYTGARMDVKFQSETTIDDRTLAARIGIKAGVKDIFDWNIQNSIDITNSTRNYSRKLSYQTRGGDPTKSLIGVINLDQSTQKIDYSAWQATCDLNHCVFVEFGTSGAETVMIYDLIADPVKKLLLKAM